MIHEYIALCILGCAICLVFILLSLWSSWRRDRRMERLITLYRAEELPRKEYDDVSRPR